MRPVITKCKCGFWSDRIGESHVCPLMTKGDKEAQDALEQIARTVALNIKIEEMGMKTGQKAKEKDPEAMAEVEKIRAAHYRLLAFLPQTKHGNEQKLLDYIEALEKTQGELVKMIETLVYDNRGIFNEQAKELLNRIENG